MEPIAVVGHVAIDRIITPGGERRQLGGPPTYVSLITHLLGAPLRAATKVGGDFPDEYAGELAARGLDVRDSVAPTAETTRFVLDYTKAERGLGYDSLCAPIEPGDVGELPDAAILAPIVGEIPGETLGALGSRVLALDPQGFVRRLGPGGSISLRPWRDADLLRRLSVFKASERELRLVAGEGGWEGLGRLARLGVLVAVETRGAGGGPHPQRRWEARRTRTRRRDGRHDRGGGRLDSGVLRGVRLGGGPGVVRGSRLSRCVDRRRDRGAQHQDWEA